MQQPIRRLCDWTPEAGPEDQWLERWERAGWIPEHGYGVEVQVGGRWVKRYAMGRVGSLADPRPDNFAGPSDADGPGAYKSGHGER